MRDCSNTAKFIALFKGTVVSYFAVAQLQLYERQIKTEVDKVQIVDTSVGGIPIAVSDKPL